ncbi:glycoside hydrolase family 19 protein [Pseudomonas sp. LFM046]|uniref:glycoside hydrolase family 19 protein n=1 Tax=Pseudomonas sp. LFM046 TaxID=1608357 RepID=UPI0005CFE331|nr:glycoside hydrolase family 19 protein [Pseudomonas sp. LFM046]
MEITKEQLLQILPNAGSKRAALFATAINGAVRRWAIDTPKRMAAFLAQVGHESGHLQYVRELGGTAYLAKYDTGKLAERLGNTPEADGDGQFYRGRGLIQITGRANYLACSLALFSDTRLLAQPQLLEEPDWAVHSAGWFWNSKGLNPLADTGEFLRITRVINGGTNGLAERREIWARARQVLGVGVAA